MATLDLRAAIEPWQQQLSPLGAAFGDAAVSAQSLLATPDSMAVGELATSALTAALPVLQSLGSSVAQGAGDLLGAIPLVGAFLGAVSTALGVIAAENERLEAGFLATCMRQPWLKTGRYPADLFGGWLGAEILIALEEADYEGELLARDIARRTEERPRALSREQRIGLATMRQAITDDHFGGGTYLFPIYLDACLAARQQLGAGLWRALAIKLAQRQPLEARGKERDWARAYARGEGSLHMSDMSGAAERFPPCDYVTGQRVARGVAYLDTWADKSRPRFFEGQAQLARDVEAMRLALGSSYRAILVAQAASAPRRKLRLVPALPGAPRLGAS